ncbi:predicted protein [Postia placenta Mad-698-R]|nr:predicted protein [Postia placenta Mad-698-R]
MLNLSDIQASDCNQNRHPDSICGAAAFDNMDASGVSSDTKDGSKLSNAGGATDESERTQQAALEAEIALFEAKIHKLTDALAIRKRKLNSLRPIHGLPPEIVAHIFTLLDARMWEDSTSFYKWIKATQFCFRWRAIALQSATLWSHIVVPPSLQWTAELLKRAGDCPLTIVDTHLPLSGAKSASLRLIMEQLPRVVELRATSNSVIVRRILERPRGQKFSAVPLDISVRVQQSQDVTISREEMSPTRSLQHIELRGWEKIWRSLMPLSGLKSIKIGNWGPLTRCMLIWLSSLPQLEILELDNTGHCFDKPEPGLQPITLSRLLRLRVVAEAAECVHVLKYVSFPLSTHIALVVTDSDFAVNDLCSMLTSKVAYSDKWLLIVRKSFSGAVHVVGGVHPFTFRYARQSRNVFGDMTFPWSAFHITFRARTFTPDNLASFCGGLHLDSVHSLYVRGKCFDSPWQWTKAFAKMDDVKALAIRPLGTYTATVEASLQRPAPGSGSQYLFPHLRRLRIMKLSQDDMYATREGSKLDGSALASILAQRRQNNVGIRKIHEWRPMHDGEMSYKRRKKAAAKRRIDFYSFRLDLTSTNWMLELLRRSGRIALSVTADFPLDPTPTLNRHSAWLASLRLVLRELPRIRELRIHAAGDVLESSLAAVDGGPTKMERLELANVGGLVDQEALKHSLSKLLANERARALRRLELTEFPYCWGDAVSFLSLRHLQLICAPESTSKPSIPELLERLSVLSTLETLRMEHVVHPLPESSEEPPVKRQTVKLPRLRYLRLAGRMIDNANILNHLHLPVDVVVSVSVSTDEDVNQHSDVLALAITAKVSDAKPICGLVMRDEGPLCFHARMLLYNMDILPPHVCDESIHADYSSTLAGAQLEIEFEETWTAWNTMAVICRQLPLTDIRSLEISGRLSTTAATEWNTIAVQMDHLTSMKVCGSVGEMFLRASIPEEVDIPDNSPLPALRDLHLHNVMCRDTHLYDNPHDDIMRPQLDPDSNVLYLWLVDRHRRGAKVDRVAVQACRNIDRKDVRLCKQFVDTLSWDRYVDIVDTATFLKRAGVYDSDSDDY